MNAVCRDIFKAIHEGKWLSIEYRNKQDQLTKYWIGIRKINVLKRTLEVEGLHLGSCAVEKFQWIYIDSIQTSQIVEGSYCPINQELVNDIHLNPHKYKAVFDQVANLKILNYLEDCNRLDTTPYKSDFALIRYLDRESFHGDIYPLSDEQFKMIVKNFQMKAQKQKEGTQRLRIQQLAVNVMSIHTPHGLYVLAYRKLELDVKQRCLRPDEDITICTEFSIDGEKESIRKYLDAGDYELLKDFEQNQEIIKDAITRTNSKILGVDDMPYLIGLGIEVVLDLHKEYRAVIEMYQKGDVTVPLKAFFGDLLERPVSRKTIPIVLLDKRVNLDQLLAIHNGMKYPVTYVQGPPGTGKTNTIINTVINAFFNAKTVLFTAYNNHPIDSAVEKLMSITYRKNTIPFPIVRLGNSDKTREALIYMRELYEKVKDISVFEKTLDKNKDDRTQRAKQLSDLLKRYDEILDLKERGETIQRLLEYNRLLGTTMEKLTFEADLGGRQLEKVEKQLGKLGSISDEDAGALISDDIEELKKYLYYTSVKYIKKIDHPKNEKLKKILFTEDEKLRLTEFNKYLSEGENLEQFLEIFPIVAVTCISAHKLGAPKAYFDMTIMDEASQCNTAIGLVPVIRGRSLMLVGDPQQLNPVILLDDVTNQKLRKKYSVSAEYDYRKNSIYKTYLACDSVSDEVLLRNHYRCNRKIIGFNNKKYYNSKLLIRTENQEKQPLVYVDVTDGQTFYKNTAPAEVEEIIRYGALYKDKSIGVITPFVNQKDAIEKRLKEEKLDHVVCGTVHAFQGDEKDIVLFSTAVTDETRAGTYEWLKNNRELINVATSRARDKLIILSNTKNLERLHQQSGEDDLYDLIQYVRSNGTSNVTPKEARSRALGIKPFSTATEEAFLANLNHAMDNIWLSQNRFTVEKEVAVAQVFGDNVNYSDLFYSGRFDFVVYEQKNSQKYPALVIELDGKEHYEDDVVMARDRKKQSICDAHQMQLIRVENSYARRYQHIKDILEQYFKVKH